jgi:hypothetical protein
MSDSMRKGLGEQASEKRASLPLTAPSVDCANGLLVQPDSTKSNTEKASESLSGAGDRIAGAVQPGMHLTPPLFSQACALTIQQRARSLLDRSLATLPALAVMTPPTRARVSCSQPRNL